LIRCLHDAVLKRKIRRIKRPRIPLLSFRRVNDVPQACIKSSQLGSAPGISNQVFSGGQNG
jgi:hypothetical protein